MSSYYVSRLYDFLRELGTNNNREWFKARKPEFDRLRELWLADLGRMIAAMGEWDPLLRHIDARRAAFRIYRDTRFSPDKTPYKTYFSATVTSGPAGYYLQMGPDVAKYQGLYAGIWCPERDVLKKLRHALVDNIEEWEEIVDNPSLKSDFHLISSSSLKTAPKGWPKDHPHVKWLRMNDYGLENVLHPDFFLNPDWPLEAARLFEKTKPFVDFLNYSIAE